MSLWSVDQLECQRFLQAYIECALWSSTNEEGEALDVMCNADDLAPETLVHMREDCNVFIRNNRFTLMDTTAPMSGHDFWLTRNGHGTGFWDRGYENELANKLTDASKQFGEITLYVGDDGKLYLM